ncbi:MAG: sulfatase-like hydrolase/transferase, partial [Pirellulales bacterium]
LEEMDRQLGMLFDYIRDDASLRDNTLVLICSDNGPEQGAGQAGPLRGFKTQLYEGGVRSPLVVWGPGLVEKQGFVNQTSVFCAMDLVPTLLSITGTPQPSGVKYDGESLPGVLLGSSERSREAPIYFRRPPDRDRFYGDDNLPDLAVRDGRWKLLCEYDGSAPELYNLRSDQGETSNLAAQHPEVTSRLTNNLTAWHQSMPADNGADFAKDAANK